MTNTEKPITTIQKEISGMDINIPSPKKFKNMKNKTLDEYEKYYEMILEGLVGSQVWQILDALEFIYHIRKKRKKN